MIKAILSLLLFYLVISEASAYPKVIHGVYTYISEDDTLCILNNETWARIRLPVGYNSYEMIIHNDKGYVISSKSGTLVIIDLQSHSILNSLHIGQLPLPMVIHNDKGYITCRDNDAVAVIDMTSNTRVDTLYVDNFPLEMVVHDHVGYVTNEGSGTVTLIDLKTQKILKTINVGKTPNVPTIYNNLGLIINNESGTLSILDLNTHTVCKTLTIASKPQKIYISDAIAYIQNYYNSITIIDLDRLTVLGNQILGNPGEITHVGPEIITTKFKKMLAFPTLPYLQRMKKKETLALFLHHNSNAFRFASYEPRVIPDNPSLFERFPPELLAAFLETWLTSSESLTLITTFKYPKRFLKSKFGKSLYEDKLHLEFFQLVWCQDRETVYQMVAHFVELDDPIITLLTRSPNHLLKHIKAGKLCHLVRGWSIHDDAMVTTPNADAVLADTLWDEHGSIMRMVQYHNTDFMNHLSEKEFIYALSANNPYAFALACFGHVQGVFGFVKSNILAALYAPNVDKSTFNNLTKMHLRSPFQ